MTMYDWAAEALAAYFGDARRWRWLPIAVVTAAAVGLICLAFAA